MARPSITGDSNLVEDQIQGEVESHVNSNSSPEKKKRKRSRHSKKYEERHDRMSLDDTGSKELHPHHDDRIASIEEKEPQQLISLKKRKKNKHRDQSKLYEVPGVENLPAKRKTSYRIAQDLATEAIQSQANDSPFMVMQPSNVSSYPGASPFMSPPKARVPHASAVHTFPGSPSAQEARLDTILKSCSRKTVANAVLDNMSLNNESEGSPSPPAIIKAEDEAPMISFREILRACDADKGRFRCPIEGCTKSYTRKDSLAGHMPKIHSGQILRDNGDKTYSVVIQTKEVQAVHGNLKSVHREIQKYTNQGRSNDGARDQLAQKVKEKELSPATKMKSPERNAPAELSAAVNSPVPDISELPDHNAEARRDSSSSPVVVRPSMPPKSPKPIKPAVGNITNVEISYGSAMEEWEVSPGIVRTAQNDLNSRGYDVAFSAHHIRNNPAVTEFANTSFAIHTIFGGRSFGFPLETFVRVCYVVSGKLQVHVDGAGFAIGRGGMWRVSSLGSCIVGNQSYEDAIIHITSIRVERGLA